ncbi:MAG TPA: hypothetical protein VN736_01290 [Candidatus Limnocylindrales bacterium]|nr:hypothetical protein [Candidatus Limnocylindrales bacterium]
MSTFARINCHNVHLEPIGGVKKAKVKSNLDRGTVWHEIKIGPIPKIGKSADLDGGTDEHSEKRFHWVRGHYADYSKGNGLFGNPKLKVVFWIPEHGRGNKEVGDVVSSYHIVGPSAEGTPSKN